MKSSLPHRFLQIAFVSVLLSLAFCTGFVKSARAVDFADKQNSEIKHQTFKIHPLTFTIPILAYHSVCGNRVSGNCVPTKSFRAQLQYLHGAGYDTVSFEDLLRWEIGIGLLPKKPVILTFDDGHRDNYTTVFPMLRQQKMKGTFFLISTKVGQ